MEKYSVTVHFPPGTKEQPRGYIADPYWPALSDLIDIQKHSGMNRAKSAANRRKALEEYLTSKNMTLADYERLEIASKIPFYMNAPVDEVINGKSVLEIVVPAKHVTSFLVATCDTARSASRPCPPDQVHSRFFVSPWTTGKTKADGVWERFVVRTAGTGQKLSNQRSLHKSPYITDFEATGTVEFDPEFVDPKTLQRAIEFGGSNVGIGAARKMGWGRFVLRKFGKV